MAVKCCNGCVPPKRHEACWGHCPDYNAEKIMEIINQAPKEKEQRVSHSVASQKFAAVDRAYKRHGSYKRITKRR